MALLYLDRFRIILREASRGQSRQPFKDVDRKRLVVCQVQPLIGPQSGICNHQHPSVVTLARGNHAAPVLVDSCSLAGGRDLKRTAGLRELDRPDPLEIRLLIHQAGWSIRIQFPQVDGKPRAHSRRQVLILRRTAQYQQAVAGNPHELIDRVHFIAGIRLLTG